VIKKALVSNSEDEGLYKPLRGATTIRQHFHTDLLRFKQALLLKPKRCNGRSRKKLLSQNLSPICSGVSLFKHRR